MKYYLFVSLVVNIIVITMLSFSLFYKTTYIVVNNYEERDKSISDRSFEAFLSNGLSVDIMLPNTEPQLDEKEIAKLKHEIKSRLVGPQI